MKNWQACPVQWSKGGPPAVFLILVRILLVLTVLAAMIAADKKTPVSLVKRITIALKKAQQADIQLGAETMYPSSLPMKQQKEIGVAINKHSSVAIREYRRVLSLIRMAREQHVVIPKQLAARAKSRAAWGLRPLVFGNNSTQWTLQKEISAIKLFPADPQPYVFISRIYRTEAMLIPFGKSGAPDPHTGKIHWVKAHPTLAQRAQRLHYLRESARYAEKVIRLAPHDTMANYLLWRDLAALGLDAKGRDFYMAVAVANRHNIHPIDFHYSNFRVKNLEATLEVYGRWERNPAYKRMQKGEWSREWPSLPKIPSKTETK